MSQDTLGLTTRYADNVVKVYQSYFAGSRSVGTVEGFSPLKLIEYFDNLSVKDESGAPVVLSTLSAPVRDRFLEGWKVTTANSMAENLEGLEGALGALADVNWALEKTLGEMAGTLDSSRFEKIYLAHYQTRSENRLKATPARSGGKASSGPNRVHWEAYYRLRSVYKPGNIIATDTVGPSPFGHAALMVESQWQPAWNIVPGSDWAIQRNARTTFAAYQTIQDNPDASPSYIDVNGNPASPILANLTQYGVSYETIGTWVNQTTWMRHAKVFEPGYRDLNIVGGGLGEWHPASDQDRAQAVANAKSHIGKPYNTDWFNLGSPYQTDRFYCSQIVWRAWYDVAQKYDFEAPLIPHIAPAELMMSDKLHVVAEWNLDDPVGFIYLDINRTGTGIEHLRVISANFSAYGVTEKRVSADGQPEEWELTTPITLIATQTLWMPQFGSNQGWTTQNSTPRMMSDVNKDGYPDVVGFASNGVVVALNNKNGAFTSPQTLWMPQFGSNQGWTTQDSTPRMMSDVNNDGYPDVVGFASNGVVVALNNKNGAFTSPQTLWMPQFGSNQGWATQNATPRMMADVNNDGYPDVVGFASNGVVVALNNKNGAFTSPQTLWMPQFGTNQGWISQDERPRTMIDVNNDDYPDVVGFASNGVVVALNNKNGAFTSPQTLWMPQFGSNQGWYTQDATPRMMADMNKDGYPDVVGFARDGVVVAFNNKNGGFTSPQTLWMTQFGTIQGWYSQNNRPRMMSDVNRDGTLDIVGFASNGVVASLVLP